MNAKSIVETVKEGVAGARNKVEMVAAHGQDVLRTGAQTLEAVKDVVVGGTREAADVATRTRQEVARTLKDGASQVADKLSRIATPTRKEAAEARKLEVKAKKQRRREEANVTLDATAAAAP
jgi:hypothetical protein